MTLTTGDVCEVAGIAPQRLNEWCSKGIVVPVSGGNGHGDHRRFSSTQTVGIVMGANLRRQKYAAALSYVRDLVAFLAEHTETELLEQFENGNTYVVPAIEVLQLGRLEYEGIETYNVQAAYETVKQHLLQEVR